ncbi:hypothetical protein BD770DRAFT_397419 [Pilaira anomala]|nr:hypothetical protein BD770DRAFT_397419 [Pilaira anomala]
MFSYIKRLFKQLSKSRWIQVYFVLVILQTLLSIPILVKTLLNAKNINQTLPLDASIRYQDALFGDELMIKEYKIVYENILFIVYEVWRIWILTDGIVHLNSLTILASAWFSLFSCIFNVMLVVESQNWATLDFDTLKVENLHLQIALTVILFILVIPVIIAAYKSSKIIGWQVYKKIGSSIQFKSIYHSVQKFALILKIDIFFQIFFMVSVVAIANELIFIFICIGLAVMLSIGLILSRVAITRESNWLMAIFLLLQVLLLVCDIYCMVGLFRYPWDAVWYIGVGYVTASIFSIIVTIYFAIICQMNFGKGLKPFVQWYPFEIKRKNRRNGSNALETGLFKTRIEERLPIDEDDDEHVVDLLMKQETLFEKHDNITRTSLERVDLVPYQLKVNRHLGLHKLDSIEFLDTSGTSVQRLKMQPVAKTSSESIRSISSLTADSGVCVASKPPLTYSPSSTIVVP